MINLKVNKKAFDFHYSKVNELFLDILCGGGLRSSNLVEIKNFTHAKSFHSSAILEGEVADFHEITRLKSCF